VVLAGEKKLRVSVGMLGPGEFSSWGPTPYFSARLLFRPGGVTTNPKSIIEVRGAKAMGIKSYRMGESNLASGQLSVPLATFAMVLDSTGKTLKWSPSVVGKEGIGLSLTDNIPLQGTLSAIVSTAGLTNPVTLNIPYNFLQGIPKASVLSGTKISTIAGVYSSIGDPYLGTGFPLAELHVSGILNSKYGVQLDTLVFGFLSNLGILKKHTT
jgi:hypothetical protein